MAARPDLPVLATTATANQRVTDDVAAQLGDDTVVLRGPLARASLTLAVVPGLTALQRYAWVAAGAADPGRVGHRLHAHRRGGRAARGLPVLHRARGRGLHRADGDGRARTRRGPAARQCGQGGGRDLGPRHGLRQARPGLRDPRRIPRVAGRLLPAGRPRRPRAGPRGRGAASRRVRRGGVGLLRHGQHPHRDRRRARCSTPWAAATSPCRCRPSSRPPGCAGRRSRGCSRCWQSTGPRLASAPAGSPPARRGRSTDPSTPG